MREHVLSRQEIKASRTMFDQHSIRMLWIILNLITFLLTATESECGGKRTTYLQPGWIVENVFVLLPEGCVASTSLFVSGTDGDVEQITAFAFSSFSVRLWFFVVRSCFRFSYRQQCHQWGADIEVPHFAISVFAASLLCVGRL